MSSFTVIDLSQLPAPLVVEDIDYETLLKEYYSQFLAKNPNYDGLVESDPAIILLQAIAYREMMLRHRINEAAKANLLAYATGSDLDQKVAGYGVARLMVEDDDRLRKRCQLSLEGYSTAGPVGAYIFHALSASVNVKSVAVASPTPGEVVVTILSAIADGTAKKRETITDFEVMLDEGSATIDGKAISNLVVKDMSGEVIYQEGKDYIFDITSLLLTTSSTSSIASNAKLLVSYERADVLDLVVTELNDENKRPLTDLVKVQPATIIPYEIEAEITVYPGPSFKVVEDEGRQLLEEYTSERHVVGGMVALSGIHNALHTKNLQQNPWNWLISPLFGYKTQLLF